MHKAEGEKQNVTPIRAAWAKVPWAACNCQGPPDHTTGSAAPQGTAERDAAAAHPPLASPVLLGSLLILVACQILVLRQLPGVADSAGLLAGLLAACLGLLVSLGLIWHGRRATNPPSATRPAAFHARNDADVREDDCTSDPCPNCGILAHLSAWLREHENAETLWPALDQFLRELLVEQLGSSRVRCYEVLAGGEQLRPLSQRQPAGWTLHTNDLPPEIAPPRPGGTSGGGANAWAGSTPGAGEDIFGQVITTRSEYFFSPRSAGALPEEPGGASGEHYEWVFPIERLPASGERATVVGLVAVGSFHGTAPPARPQRQAIIRWVELLWNYVDCRTRLHIVGQTDRATGVLTRGDFFVIAQEALRESYRHNEPAIVAILSLEGLRGLDDRGLWPQRDALVENVAHLVRSRLRSDDVVGRFSDDRFVLLLRRLETGLGRLIIEKLVGAIDVFLADRRGVGTQVHLPVPLAPVPIRVRAGLASSGLREICLATLVASAIEAADLARRLDRSVCLDLDSPASTQSGNVAGRGAQTMTTGGSNG